MQYDPLCSTWHCPVWQPLAVGLLNMSPTAVVNGDVLTFEDLI